MVIVDLGSIRFEAEKFESKIMPTPDLKGKEMIYWIRFDTEDKRMVADLRRYLDVPSKVVELKVPSLFVWAKAELEVCRIEPRKNGEQDQNKNRATGPSKEEPYTISARSRSLESQDLESQELDNGAFTVEIVLRRAIPESPKRQSPYG